MCNRFKTIDVLWRIKAHSLWLAKRAASRTDSSLRRLVPTGEVTGKERCTIPSILFIPLGPYVSYWSQEGFFHEIALPITQGITR